MNIIKSSSMYILFDFLSNEEKAKFNKTCKIFRQRIKFIIKLGENLDLSKLDKFD